MCPQRAEAVAQPGQALFTELGRVPAEAHHLEQQPGGVPMGEIRELVDVVCGNDPGDTVAVPAQPTWAQA
ncbi:hypothetical protein [Streptomyces sp. NPDC088847]|uniref:hypothetical protein n=1 Tax=Streptomyces sp. NPDC088847 TaxID=3365909 RepID=UPI00382677FB